jgi:MbtH protein
MNTDDNDRHSYLVVVNDEEQYSIWFADRDLPVGWRAIGPRGTREQCLDLEFRSSAGLGWCLSRG